MKRKERGLSNPAYFPDDGQPKLRLSLSQLHCFDQQIESSKQKQPEQAQALRDRQTQLLDFIDQRLGGLQHIIAFRETNAKLPASEVEHCISHFLSTNIPEFRALLAGMRLPEPPSSSSALRLTVEEAFNDNDSNNENDARRAQQPAHPEHHQVPHPVDTSTDTAPLLQQPRSKATALHDSTNDQAQPAADRAFDKAKADGAAAYQAAAHRPAQPIAVNLMAPGGSCAAIACQSEAPAAAEGTAAAEQEQKPWWEHTIPEPNESVSFVPGRGPGNMPWIRMDQRKEQTKDKRARHMALNDYKLHAWWGSGIRELYADCHIGLELADFHRTWSIMQLERAQRTLPGFAWRIKHGPISQHIEKVKEVYYEARRQMAELGKQGVSEADAHKQVLISMSRNPNWKQDHRLERTVPQIWAAIVSKPGRESNAEYERRVFGW